ncbi:MAG: AAA family ATPase [Acidobacteriaceae bacterium]|nr:AAA family ATPase [Acidobacteriaceae bacterium]MBV9778485.1 AAA family ATPase [Acidobacteriaceae bacterium]
MSSSNLLLYITDDNLRREAIDTLRRSDNPVSYDEHDSDWASLLERIGKTKPEVLLLGLSGLSVELSAAIRQIRYHVPRIRVIALNSSADPQTILSAMRAGTNEFVHSPLADHLPQALERILSTPDPDLVQVHRGKIVGFLSAKGGCGATTLACHVATELQKLTRKNVLLADLDLTCGLVGFLMKTPSSYSILDAVKNLTRLDESLWRALIVEHRPNLAVIPAPASYTRWDHPDENQLRQVLQFMRTQHDWVVLDLGRSLNSIATAVLDELDQLFLVSTLEVVALHGLKSIVHGLFDQGEKLQLVLNRTPKMMDISTQELENILGRSLYAALPNDYMGLYQSYSSGNLLDSNNRLAQQIGLLAGKIAGLSPVKSKKKFALFG